MRSILNFMSFIHHIFDIAGKYMLLYLFRNLFTLLVWIFLKNYTIFLFIRSCWKFTAEKH